jgi:uncharacterized protein with von Willebrand factor type A (vWA) domain
MLSLLSLNLLLSINEDEVIDELITHLLATPQMEVFFTSFPHLKNTLLKDLPTWKINLRQKVQETVIPPELEKEIYLYKESQKIDTTGFANQLTGLLEQLKQVNSSFTDEANTLKNNALSVSKSSHVDRSFQLLFLQRWRQSLIFQTVNLHNLLLEKEQEQLQTTLQQQLELTRELSPLLVENDAAAGRLWDMTRGKRRQGDYRPFLRYAAFLQQQPELLQLAEQLGRSQKNRTLPEQHSTQEPLVSKVRESQNIPEKITGIHHSADIMQLMPTELGLMGNEELEYEFYRRLVEKNLLTYQLRGEIWREKIVMSPVTKRFETPHPRGPFLVCVDTSGSMGGFNELCAKAFCLALLRLALADNRQCYIMLFSHEIVHYELTSKNGLDQALRFLGQQFRGGTNIAACMNVVQEKLASPKWQDADAVVISDFIAQRLPDDTQNAIKQLQRQGHRFHAVAMSNYGKPGIMGIFDHVWRFDTSLKSRIQRRWNRK